jgi:serine/threonine protein kinase
VLETTPHIMPEGGPKSDAAAAIGDTVPGVGTDLAPGSIVGEYRIERVVGRGGMGVVYAAIQPVIEKKVAIKVLAAQFSSAPELVRRFVDEARAVNRIGHDNIIDIFSFGQLPDGRHYFVMEYLEGATLGERLARGDLPSVQLPSVLGQICDALDAAHAKKIVHRDLKPENIWIAGSARGLPRVRLLDFGIAKLLDTGDKLVTDVGAVMGTPHFMSPEQCNGSGVDHRTDIYAMGVIMYQLYTGRLPITGETYAQILAKQITERPAAPSAFASLPEALDRLIVRCLEKDPAARPQSAAELAKALAGLFPGQIDADPLTPPFGSSSAAVAAAMGSTAPSVASPVSASPTAANGPTSAPAALDRKPPPTGRLIAIAVGLVLVVGLVIVLVGRRGNSPPAPAPVTSAQAAPAAPASPVPLPVPPPAISPVPARQAAPPAPAAKRRGPAEAKSYGAAEKPSRASRTGLVTDNPFE